MPRQKAKSEENLKIGNWEVRHKHFAQGGQGITHLVRNSSPQYDQATYVLKEL